MNILMMPALPENSSAVINDAVGQLNKTEGESFTSYLERSQEVASNKNESLLGVSNPQGAENELDNRIAELIDDEEITTIPGLLQHMMQLLQEQAEEIETGPGDWLFTLPDSNLMEKLALASGMTEEEVSRFLQLFPITDGEEINLAGLLQNLAEHFSNVSNENPIVVPDTEFPLFAALLSKMGMGMDQVENIADQAINGQDQLDLGLLVETLNNLVQNGQMQAGLQGEVQVDITEEMLAPVQLRPWEVEQLTSLLQKMGLSEQDLRNLSIPLPENNSSLDLPKLAEFLNNALEVAKNNQPQPDPMSFLDKLGQLFNEAGFKEQTAGFTPVVQNSIESIYRKLMDTVDLSKVRMQVVDGEQKPQTTATSIVDMIMEEGAVEGEEFFGAAGEEGDQSSEMPKGPLNLVATVEAGLNNNEENPVVIKFDPNTAAVSAEGISQDVSATNIKEQPIAPTPRTQQAMVQQTIDQLSQAVARGASRNEHHLIIKLYPENLGEVKVNLHVRDEQVSVSFTMENSRVKDILESNMQDFKNSLEKHGFNLGDLSASVDKQEQGEDKWQQFNEFAKERFWNIPKENLTDLPEDILYRKPMWLYPESEIDLRV